MPSSNGQEPSAVRPVFTFDVSEGDSRPTNSLTDPAFVRVMLSRMFSPLSLRIVTEIAKGALTFSALQSALNGDSEKTKLRLVLAQLVARNLVVAYRGAYHLADDDARAITTAAIAVGQGSPNGHPDST